MEGWKRFLQKRVYVSLKSKRCYSGKIEEITDTGNGLIFLTIQDKKGNFVVFTSSEIEFMQTEDNYDM